MHKRKSSLTLLAFAASMACWYGVLGQCFCYQKGSNRLCQASFGGGLQPETRRDAKKLSFSANFSAQRGLSKYRQHTRWQSQAVLHWFAKSIITLHGQPWSVFFGVCLLPRATSTGCLPQQLSFSTAPSPLVENTRGEGADV